MAHPVEDLCGFDKFKEIIDGSTPAIFDIWAPWCPPCKMMGPIFNKLAAQNPEARFYKINNDDETDIIHFLGVKALPVFFAYKDGKEVAKVQGAFPAKMLDMVHIATGKIPAPTPAPAADTSAAAAAPPPPQAETAPSPAPTPAAVPSTPAPTPAEPTPAPGTPVELVAHPVEDITDFDKFKEIIAGRTTAVFDIWAPWCPPCKMMGPVFEKAAAQYPQARFYKIDHDEERDIMEFLGVKGLPVFFAYRDGKEVGKSQGAVPPKLLEMIRTATTIGASPDVAPTVAADAPTPDAAAPSPAPGAAPTPSPVPAPAPAPAPAPSAFSMDEDF